MKAQVGHAKRTSSIRKARRFSMPCRRSVQAVKTFARESFFVLTLKVEAANNARRTGAYFGREVLPTRH